MQTNIFSVGLCVTTVRSATALVYRKRKKIKICKLKHTYLHEPLKLEELAMQIFKVLFEKVPEPVIKHDLDQHAESLLLRHLRKTTQRVSN